MHEFRPFRLDTVNQCLWRRHASADDERIALTPKAFAALRYLVEHAGQLVSQEELLEAVWPETFIKPEVLKSRIFELRRALGDRPKAPRFIETLPRRGSRFIAAVDTGLVGEPAVPAPPAPHHLVGREHELGALHECLHRALHQQRQLVLVTGEPGIGTTALVDAFAQQAAAAVLYERTGSAPGVAQHRRLSRSTILQLAQSLPAEERLRTTFLSAPRVRVVLGDTESILVSAAGP